MQAAHDKVEEVEERSRNLYDCNQRLEAHVHDLESRKRAPLYQKKQEEELKAAVDKAIEAETRAHEAELRAKEHKVGSCCACSNQERDANSGSIDCCLGVLVLMSALPLTVVQHLPAFPKKMCMLAGIVL